ncbi:MAG: Gfo/Idh/MocA family oxidoreductase [Geobacteraceae bacterium]|nr:Gfo/Idh/MocA family oxidoreductase [Geobacteraceae bacterium]NTW79535.1 Gfo/Idh/MocA family oxidoreductase [Geobacteraceae bacterium]
MKDNSMSFLVIGLGSMGKRRIRCLQALGANSICGYDPRLDRREEVTAQYGVTTYKNFSTALAEGRPNALIISVPPDLHHGYMMTALEQRLPFFVEASVLDDGMAELINELNGTPMVAAPSATLLFHPAISIIEEKVKSGTLGKISNVIHHSGQFLPDWHTYEAVSDYYVSNPATGGGREIVPFELSWFTRVFGFPDRVCGNFRKTIDISGAAQIDDTYNALLDYGNFLASFTVDVVSRHATRRLLINGDLQQLIWDWDENSVRLFDPEKGVWEKIEYDMGSAAAGYNANIGESMYIDEIRNFIEAIEGKRPFSNSLENDHRVLKLLYAIEEADRSGAYVRFNG